MLLRLSKAIHFHRGFSTQILHFPIVGESVSDGDILKFYVKEGQHVVVDTVLTEIETHKKLVSICAPTDGYISKYLVKPPTKVDVLQPICEFTSKPSTISSIEANTVTSSPLVQKLAEVTTHLNQIDSVFPKVPKNVEILKVPIRKERIEPLSRLRKVVSQRLKEAQNTCALLTTFQEVNMEECIKTKELYADEFSKKYGVKLGFMSFFVKACTLALKQQPLFNAYIQNTDVVFRDYIDISVAVASPRGLVVPVLRNTDHMSFSDVENTISEFAKKAKENKLEIEEMTGGTFTISNGGVYGSFLGTPIINLPQSAIMGMHSIQKRPVVVGEQILIQRMMNLALTYDHRLLDGRDAVTFLGTVKKNIENPTRMLLNC